MKIVFIGSGNLATQLSLALCKSGHDMIQVYSRTLANASCLAEELGCKATDTLDEVVYDADAYIISVKDDVLPDIVRKVCKDREQSVFIHTAGSVPMSVFDGLTENYGVFYPMQTFSKTRNVNFREIPTFIEGSNAHAVEVIQTLAESVSTSVIPCDSDRRKYLHLAAVFACNMTNHCYRLCEQVLEEQNLDFNLFLPLINETARKVAEMSPRDAQTGPMVRYDKTIMEGQMNLITRPLSRDIYAMMAKSIHEDKMEYK